MSSKAAYSSSHLTVSSQRVVHYTVWQGDRKPNKMPKLNKAYNISGKAKQRIKDYVNLLIDTARYKTIYERKTQKYWRFKVNFITLTLPSKQMHNDKEIHEKCFKTFIRAIKQKHNGFMYLYKAEVQDNGNLHYHLTTNTFLHYDYLKNTWNYYVNKLGYVDRSGHANPPSTHVKAVKNINNLAGYICKYITKGDYYTKVLRRWHRVYGKRMKNREMLECKLPNNYFKHIKRQVEIKRWDCSKTLKIGKCTVDEPNNRMHYELCEMVKLGAEYVQLDYVSLWTINRKLLNESKELGKVWRTYCKRVSDENAKVNHNIII